MTLCHLYPARIRPLDNTKQALEEHCLHWYTSLTPNRRVAKAAQSMDPFFDDDEEYDVNLSGDGCGNPFTDKHAVPGNPAGNAYGMSTPELGINRKRCSTSSTVAPGKGGMPPGWSFDDEPAHQPATSRPAPASSSGGGLKATMKKSGGGWKWHWTKEQVLEGERNVWLNDSARNIGEGYPNNHMSISKYNLAAFIPKFLVEQFSKYANLFFLFTAFIQQVPGVSPTNQYTTIEPLSLAKSSNLVPVDRFINYGYHGLDLVHGA